LATTKSLSASGVSEFLAVGKNAVELHVGVEVAEQDLRRGGLLERQRRTGGE
jgi:hypothetical protein